MSIQKDDLPDFDNALSDTKLILLFKVTDRLCKVVELSMQCSGQILEDTFETYNTPERSVNPEFERKIDGQNRTFGWIRFLNFFLNY